MPTPILCRKMAADVGIVQEPIFKGRLITSDASDDDAGLLAFHVIVDKSGWDYMTNYMAMAPRFTRDAPDPSASNRRPPGPPLRCSPFSSCASDGAAINSALASPR